MLTTRATRERRRETIGIGVDCDTQADGQDYRRFADERGSVLPLLSFVLVGFVCASVLVVAVAQHAVAEARAQAAADAAALAGAAEGEEAGRLLAEANGAKLLSFNISGQRTSSRSATVVVEVAVGKATARAAAARFFVDSEPPREPIPVGEDD